MEKPTDPNPDITTTVETTSHLPSGETSIDQQARREDAATMLKARGVPDRLPTKAERALPRIMLMIACVAYLFIALSLITKGLRGISTVVERRFAKAEADLHMGLYLASSSKRREQLTYSQLEDLLTSQLPRIPMETHEECLARGLETANKQFFGRGFYYADIREETMDWTMENCARLLFTPQVRDQTLQQVVLTYWARASYHGCQMAEEAIRFVKQKAHWIWNKMFSVHLVQNNFILIDYVPPEHQPADYLSDQHPYQRTHARMPFGFDLDYEDNKPCRLVYHVTLEELPHMPTTSEEAITKGTTKVVQLLTFEAKLDAILHVIGSSRSVLLQAQGLLAMTSLAMWAVNSEDRVPFITGRPTLATVYCLPNEAKEWIYWIFLELVAMLPCCVAINKHLLWSSIILMIGIFYSMLGFTVLLSFFFRMPTIKTLDVFMFYGLVEDLYSIMWGESDSEDSVKLENVVAATVTQAESGWAVVDV